MVMNFDEDGDGFVNLEGCFRSAVFVESSRMMHGAC